MIKNGHTIANSKVLVLGITFKENCPDIRNSRVIDVIRELEEFGCAVDVYDPWVDPKEKKQHYRHGIIEDPFLSDTKYSAIVVAVAHDQFLSLEREDYERISTPEMVLIDVKGILDNPTWRL